MNLSLFTVEVNQSSDVGIVESSIINGYSGVSLAFLIIINDDVR
jgi:hypothetical protein